MIYGGLFDIDSKERKLDEINILINDSSFWKREDKDKILKEEKYLSSTISEVKKIRNTITSNISLFSSDLDESMLGLLNNDYKELFNQVEKIKIDAYLSGPYDKNDCILEIHSGAGGTEACDWVMMLYRMYTRYLSKSNYKYMEIDRQYGEEVGLKSIMLKISGINAYGYFKGEKGIHRLVRISPFDAGKRRHTSFASVEVIPELAIDQVVDIAPQDLKIDIFRSSGPGGQGVNTTDSAVRITHIPTGIVVSCQNERSQIRNRQIALEILKNKIANLEMTQKSQELEKIKGKQMSISFGSTKRSYVMCPYTLVKDNESGYENNDVNRILDGDIGEILEKNIRR